MERFPHRANGVLQHIRDKSYGVELVSTSYQTDVFNYGYMGRLKQRNFLNLDTDEWEKVKARIRAESLIPINKKSFYEDDLWYGIVDVESLFSDDDVEERFANRFRLRIA